MNNSHTKGNAQENPNTYSKKLQISHNKDVNDFLSLKKRKMNLALNVIKHFDISLKSKVFYSISVVVPESSAM